MGIGLYSLRFHKAGNVKQLVYESHSRTSLMRSTRGLLRQLSCLFYASTGYAQHSSGSYCVFSVSGCLSRPM